jgi:lactoylglutathione lyase
MRTLNIGLYITDSDRSLVFYSALGFEVVGRVPGSPIGDLTMLKLAGDEFVSVELVHDRSRRDRVAGGSFSHLAIKVESMSAVVAALAGHGIVADPPTSPDGSGDFLTTSIVDPDGNRIELVQWPPGHADGLSAADWVT